MLRIVSHRTRLIKISSNSKLTTIMASTLKRKSTDALKDTTKKAKQSGISSFFKPTESTTDKSANEKALAPAAPKFDKEAWVDGLTTEQKELLKLEIDTMHESWLAVLKDELVTTSFLNLKKFLNKEWAGETPIYPPKADIYSWSHHTPLNKVKVVILGQDPYHGPNQAHGLCFSVRPPNPAPASLKNIYKALKNDYPTFIPPPNNSGLLTPWADQGVLMINTCLTVRKATANSHSEKGWEKLTGKVIDIVNNKRPGVVFLAWGSPAQKRCVNIHKKHIVLKATHPSPLSAPRGGWFDCGHFKKTNEWLCTRYGEDAEINWNLDVDTKKPDV